MQNREPMGICCVTQGTELGLCDNLEVWDGEGDGNKVQEGGVIWIPMVDSC